MSWFRRKAPEPDKLIGRWRIDPTDTAAVEQMGDVVLEFDDEGNLTYVVRAEARDQLILMTYRIDGDSIVTDQPSSPRPERTKFDLARHDLLILWFEGASSRFLRA